MKASVVLGLKCFDEIIGREFVAEDPVSLTVSYKYTSSMPIVKKKYSAFIESIVEKTPAIVSKKLEIHVSPFYKHKRGLYWHPVLDFDGEGGVREAKKFLSREIAKDFQRLWFAELSGVGCHLVYFLAVGPFRIQDVQNLRVALKTMKAKYSTLDVNMVRDLPIRRTPSLDSLGKEIMLPLPYNSFLSGDDSPYKVPLTPTLVETILKRYTLPSSLLSFKPSR